MLAILGKIPAGFILATDRINIPDEGIHPLLSPDAGAGGILLSSRRPLAGLVWGSESLSPMIPPEWANLLEAQGKRRHDNTRQIAFELAQSLFREGRQKFAGLMPYLRPRMGFFLAGFEGEGMETPSDWVWDMAEPFVHPRPLRTDRPGESHYGFNWRGLDLWMTRLFLGYDPALLRDLENEWAIPPDQALPLFRKVELPFSYSAMSVEQGMEVASFMIHTTLGLLHLQTYPRKWNWKIEMALVTPQGARWILGREGGETGHGIEDAD